MKKNGIINGPISSVISLMGHEDMIAIGDAGLPIPEYTQRIDLALKPGVPGFLETLETLIQELHVEKAYVASEILKKSPEMYEGIKEILVNIPIEIISHNNLKVMTATCKAVIRTAEFTPYANIILQAGVWGFEKV